MKRLHLLLLILVAIVLALFALKVSEKADLPPIQAKPPVKSEIQPGPPPSEQRPSGSIGREDPGIGTTTLPRGPGSLERP